MRFAWDYREQYLVEQQLGPLRRRLASQATKRIQRWDKAGSSGVDIWLANSQTVANRIKRYYQQHAEVVYPPVVTSLYTPKPNKRNYYLTLSGLTPYKKIELAIAACNISGRQLIVAGEGTDRVRLEKLAGPTIRFTGYVSNAKKRQLLENAKGLIYPNEEDFGIVPVEAMAAGTPVIAFNSGGVAETVVQGKTGWLFKEQTIAGLVRALNKFETMQFSTNALAQRAALFDSSIFRKRIKQIVGEASSRVKTN
ncbi:MAG TPA: glycosyltransferase [Candidatus Babeliales bacterium]|nr:glycosyltransferase [Candidatus Babeliales bacterium]